jgi:hypothetical protein
VVEVTHLYDGDGVIVSSDQREGHAVFLQEGADTEAATRA